MLSGDGETRMLGSSARLIKATPVGPIGERAGIGSSWFMLKPLMAKTEPCRTGRANIPTRHASPRARPKCNRAFILTTSLRLIIVSSRFCTLNDGGPLQRK